MDDALGFALTWNYWFNDAVSTASDIIALQLLLEYWTNNFPGWAISLIFLVVVICLNLLSVRVYGEVEYWLSLLKVITIVVCPGLYLISIWGTFTEFHRSSSFSVLSSTVVVIRTMSTSAVNTGTWERLLLLAASVDLPPSSSRPLLLCKSVQRIGPS